MNRCVECDHTIEPAARYFNAAGEPAHMLCVVQELPFDYTPPESEDIEGYIGRRPNALEIEMELVKMEREYRCRNDNDPED